MDRKKDIVYKFKKFQDDFMTILQETEKERDECKSQIEEVQASYGIVQDELSTEQRDNINLRATVEELRSRNESLEAQVKELEAERQKYVEQLNVLGAKQRINIDNNNENTKREIRNVVTPKQEPALKRDSKKVESSADKKKREDPVANEELGSLQDYSFSTQFSPIKKVEENYDELFADSQFQFFEGAITPASHMNGTLKNDEKESKKISGVSKSINKNEKPLRGLIIPETVDNETYIIDSENEKTPDIRRLSDLEKSPVLRDQSGKKRKNSSTSLEANGNENAGTSMMDSPIRVKDQKQLLKPQNSSYFGMSPAKRWAMEDSDIFNTPVKFKSPKRNKTSPKKTPKKLTLQRTPKKSPARGSQLKKSHLIDAEKTFGGMKKMTQTKLNLDIFTSKKRNEKENQAGGSNKPDLLRPPYNYMTQTKKDEDDDILIDGSPQTKSKSLMDSPPKPGGSKATSQPSETFYDDPEATYVSSLFVRNWKENQKFDDIPEEKPPIPKPKTLSPTERIPDPDGDSPPFAYKRGAVRKKADRKKLPGHVCYGCEAYYRSAYGDNLSQKQYQEMLNRCSRHRDKYPDLDNTPPGFWKPYLTMTPKSPEHF